MPKRLQENATEVFEQVVQEHGETHTRCAVDHAVVKQ